MNPTPKLTDLTDEVVAIPAPYSGLAGVLMPKRQPAQGNDPKALES